ncbi:hypothetical protein [Tardiphaga sp.]|jgi:hypothetical protein|uniref:hypothetical protein n=1 Tax=Tardiphaga sp. TaxID=1926292 RepID=UPI0037DA1322
MLRDAAAWFSFKCAVVWKAAAKACLWMSRLSRDLEEWFATSMTWREIRENNEVEDEPV